MPPKKSLDVYVEQTFPVRCRGRGAQNEELFSPPIDVLVKIHKSPGSNMISSLVECPYNRGPHGEYCSALTETVLGKKAREDTFKIHCAYAFDVPKGD